MQQKAYFLAKIGADTAENEQQFAEICRSAVVPPAHAADRARQHGRDGEVRAEAPRVQVLGGPRHGARPSKMVLVCFGSKISNFSAQLLSKNDPISLNDLISVSSS